MTGFGNRWFGTVVAIGLCSLVGSRLFAAPPVADDLPRLRAAGLRVVTGKHVVIYTDLPASAEVDQLPAVFDQAVPQWCRYFDVALSELGDWKMTAYLMDRKETFRATKLFPQELPPFLHGYQRDSELWLYEQPSAYYRRHLLLHEGTHGFMNRFLGSAGPPWFMEGVAEFLGTHRWEEGRLTLGYFPQDKEETPGWGRIKIIKDEVAAGRAQLLTTVMRYDARAHLRNEPYAWSWAAAAFFDADPRTQKAFRQLRSQVRDPQMTARFYEQLRADWSQLRRQWQLFVLDMDYGYDLARERIDDRPVAPLPADGSVVKIRADRGWQSTGWQLKADTTYRISAQGRYQIAREPKIWWCEPGGVTIRYHGGRPAGMLMGAVESLQVGGLTALARPRPIGLDSEFKVTTGGTLYLRINESGADLGDNQGELRARIVAD